MKKGEEKELNADSRGKFQKRGLSWKSVKGPWGIELPEQSDRVLRATGEPSAPHPSQSLSSPIPRETLTLSPPSISSSDHLGR